MIEHPPLLPSAPDERDSGLDIESVERLVQASEFNRRRRDSVSQVAYPLAASVAFLVLWEIVVRLLRIPDYLVPAPSQVITVFAKSSPLLLRDSVVTIQEILAGFSLGVILGIPLALGIFLSPAFGRTVYPALVSSQAVPKSAIAPLFVVWFGFGLLPKVLIAFLISFFPIVISTVVGLEGIEPEKILLARSMGMSSWTTFFRIRLPQALPSVFGGLKVAITLAVVGAIVGEFVGSDEGLGYLLLTANGNLDTPLLFAGLVALTLIGIVFFLLIETLERIALPWHHAENNGAVRESM